MNRGLVCQHTEFLFSLWHFILPSESTSVLFSRARMAGSLLCRAQAAASGLFIITLYCPLTPKGERFRSAQQTPHPEPFQILQRKVNGTSMTASTQQTAILIYFKSIILENVPLLSLIDSIYN